MPTTPTTEIPTTEAIATLAYEYWEADGRPNGKDIEHWLKAEQTLTMPPVKDAHVLQAANHHRRRGPTANLRHA